MHANDFAFSYNRFMRLLTTPLLAGPRHSTIVVEPDDVVVRMGVAGWTFASRVPRASIVDLARVPGPVMAWGAHGWRGRWLVNGSGVGLVRLTIEPNAQARCMGFPLRLRELTLSLAEPDAFIVAVATPG